MKLLLHVCCAPCSTKYIEALREEGLEPTLFWYNPNIHPVTEYRSRRDAMIGYAEEIGTGLLLQDHYGLRPFVEAVSSDIDHRCNYCYDTRLGATARYAAENGYDGFSTTLLISPYQNHELICETGEKAAGQNVIRFIYRDFRPYFRQGQQTARELGIYMQKYCGCIFSEEDRYLGKHKK